MRQKILIATLFLLPSLVFSQTVEADNYGSELIWGVNKNTSGGLIGGLFNSLNTKLCHLRRDYLSARAINKNVRSGSGGYKKC